MSDQRTFRIKTSDGETKINDTVKRVRNTLESELRVSDIENAKSCNVAVEIKAPAGADIQRAKEVLGRELSEAEYFESTATFTRGETIKGRGGKKVTIPERAHRLTVDTGAPELKEMDELRDYTYRKFNIRWNRLYGDGTKVYPANGQAAGGHEHDGGARLVDPSAHVFINIFAQRGENGTLKVFLWASEEDNNKAEALLNEVEEGINKRFSNDEKPTYTAIIPAPKHEVESAIPTILENIGVRDPEPVNKQKAGEPFSAALHNEEGEITGSVPARKKSAVRWRCDFFKGPILDLQIGSTGPEHTVILLIDQSGKPEELEEKRNKIHTLLKDYFPVGATQQETEESPKNLRPKPPKKGKERWDKKKWNYFFSYVDSDLSPWDLSGKERTESRERICLEHEIKEKTFSNQKGKWKERGKPDPWEEHEHNPFDSGNKEGTKQEQ